MHQTINLKYGSVDLATLGFSFFDIRTSLLNLCDNFSSLNENVLSFLFTYLKMVIKLIVLWSQKLIFKRKVKTWNRQKSQCNKPTPDAEKYAENFTCYIKYFLLPSLSPHESRLILESAEMNGFSHLLTKCLML